MAIAASHAAPEIEAQVYAHQRAMNSSRFVPETPEMYQRASLENRLYIFNVGPWAHKRELGSAGTFCVPACPEGREYSEPLVIDGVVQEPYPINEVECKVIYTEGIKLAEQIIGEGPFIPRSLSFVPYGVFISQTSKPSKQALDAARRALAERHLEHIREANAAWIDGPAKASEVIRPEWHVVSAHALKKSKAECPWLGESLAPAGRDNCPGCGSVFNIGVLKCRECGFILDKPRYDEAVKNGLFAQ